VSAETLPPEYFDAAGEYVGPAFTDKDKQYIKIFVALLVLTGIEVGLSYTPLVDRKAAFAIPMLALAGLKFTVVAGYFMHLKFDSPLMRRLFILGAVLAGFCYTAVLSAVGQFRGWGHWIVFLVFAVGVLAVWMFRGDDGVVKGADGGPESVAAPH
jgi:cytochrome c oxidase subunit IV